MDVRKFINEWSKPNKNENLPNIISQGLEKGVFYYTEESIKKYLIISPSKEALKELSIHEIEALLPKFGKYEIEDFFNNRFINAVLVTGDMTDIFNTTVLCTDYFRPCKFEKNDVKDIFLEKCFTIVKDDKEDNTIYLKLTGKRS